MPSNPAKAPYLESLYIVPENIPAERSYPFDLPFIPNLNLNLDAPITFLVGENGSGKSTVLEAIADLCGYNIGGGGREEVMEHTETSRLASALRPRFRRRPKSGFFFRAETLFNFANLLDERKKDPDFSGDPYSRYGGNSLHTRSHGESFLTVFKNRIQEGLFLVDEPEAALSPQRQLSLLSLLADRVARGNTQFIIATHSPILLTYPNARIIDFETEDLREVSLKETKHYQLTKGMLDHPEEYWRHLISQQD